MASAASPSARDFGAPFDYADADVCLRSVDGCHFRAHKAILAVASGTLRDLGFAAPSGPRDTRDGLAVLPFVAPGEDAAVVANFLRLAYPTESPVLAGARDVRLLLEFCRKYQSECVGRLEKLLLSDPLLKTHPVALYSLACVYRLEQLARATASESLRHPGVLQDANDKEYLGLMSGLDLYRLLQYHRQVADIAAGVASPSGVSDLLGGDDWTWWTCGSCHADPYFYDKPRKYGPRAWWTKYVRDCQAALTAAPLPETVSKEELVYTAVAEASKCSKCAGCVVPHMSAFVPAFRRRVELKTSEVRLLRNPYSSHRTS
jgi:hypothetical protein